MLQDFIYIKCPEFRERDLNLIMVPDIQLCGYTKNPLKYTLQISKLYDI